MGSSLTNIWKSYALPDGHPDKDLLENQESLSRAETIRRESYLERTTDLVMNKHTRDDDRKASKQVSGKRMDDLLMFAIGSPEYIAAYNHQISFTIGDEELNLTQGQLHDSAKRYADDLRQRMEQGRRSGLDVIDLAMMTAELGQVEQVIEISDPQCGVMSEQEYESVNRVVQESEGFQDYLVEEYGSVASPEISQNNIIGGDVNSEVEEHLSQWGSSNSQASLASKIEASPFAAMAVSASTDFNRVAPNFEVNMPADPTPAPGNNSGFSI